ncbi:MAG: kelch repeat-containing protein [Pseudomonadota bacterium]
MTGLTRRRLIASGATFGAGAALGPLTALWPSGADAHPHPDDKPARTALGAWSAMPGMPFPVQEIYPTAHRLVFPSAANPRKPVTKELIVNAGGLTPNAQPAVSDALTIYDPALGEWYYGEALPWPMHHAALVSNNGYLFVCGGFTADERGAWQMQPTVWQLSDFNDGVWEEIAPLPLPQAETVTVSLNGRINVVGGRSPVGSANAQWRDHIDTDNHFVYIASENRWEPRKALPMARNSAAGAVWRGALYVIGGRTVSGGNTPRVDVYDPVTDRWQAARPLPKPAAGPHGAGGLAAAAYGGCIYVFGGEWFSPSGGGVYSEVWEYDPREDHWRGVAAMPRPRHGLGAVSLKDGVYVLGGASRPSGDGTSSVMDRFSI